jgi:hypothetical protein
MRMKARLVSFGFSLLFQLQDDQAEVAGKAVQRRFGRAWIIIDQPIRPETQHQNAWARKATPLAIAIGVATNACASAIREAADPPVSFN